MSALQWWAQAGQQEQWEADRLLPEAWEVEYEQMVEEIEDDEETDE